jgi:hypothetical protein
MAPPPASPLGTPDCGQSRARMSLRDAARLVCHRPTETEWRHPNNLCSRSQVPIALRGLANRWPHQIPETPAPRDEPLGAAGRARGSMRGPGGRRGRATGSRSLWRDGRSRRGGAKPPTKLAFFAAQQSAMTQASIVLARLSCFSAHGCCRQSMQPRLVCAPISGRVRAGPGSRRAGSFPTSVRSATADTTGNPPAGYEAPDQGRACPPGDSGTIAPG